MDFVNRTRELLTLSRVKSGLVVVTGRRRIGKTRLIGRLLSDNGGHYCQAIEASPDQQIQQVFADTAHLFKTSLEPRTWEQYFELVDSITSHITLCIDEFPYLVATDSSIPSRFQRWLDHSNKKNKTIILCGSSQRMMFSSVLSHSSPLFGRASTLLQLEPMNYFDFCAATGCDVTKRDSFRLFSLVGGVPKYWELIGDDHDPVTAADNLYFGFAAYLEGEPKRILRDERIEGIQPLSVLEAVGRGASRPSEIASKMGAKQTALSKLLQLLGEASLLHRELPFGESSRSTKRTSYTIRDEALAFWFSTFSPHRSRWHSYSKENKLKLIDLHTSRVFEQTVRQHYPNAARYWEAHCELDIVYHPPESATMVNVIEVKWGQLTTKERNALKQSLKEKATTTALASKYQLKGTDIITFEDFIALE